MNSITLKILCLIAISLPASHCDCQVNENITMIYAVGDQAFAKEYGKNNTLTDLGRFDGDVTGFSKYNGYLYVSVKRSWFFLKDSAIWRVKLDNSSSSGINASTWMKFHVLNQVREDILSLVVAKGYIYAGRSDGIMWRCAADEPDSCENFNDLDGINIAVDYNPVEDRIYAFAYSECHPFNYAYPKVTFKFLKSCSADTANSCDYIALTNSEETINFYKFAFNATWFDTGKSYLSKCSYNEANETITYSYGPCSMFNNIGPFDFIHFSTSNRYVYIYTPPGSHIWRCDPSVPKSCTRPFEAPTEDDMGPFIIL